jgi:hypothetical protein
MAEALQYRPSMVGINGVGRGMKPNRKLKAT